MKPMKMALLQPALHLLVHVAALGAVALVHEHIEATSDRRRLALQVGCVELVDQRAQKPRRCRPQLLDELVPRGDAGRRRIRADHPGVLHHPFDLLVEFVAVGDRRGCGPPDRAPAATWRAAPSGCSCRCPAYARSRRPRAARMRSWAAFTPKILVRPWHLLLAAVEDDEVADQIEQPRLRAHLRQRPVEQRPRRRGAIRPGASSFHSTKNFSGVPTVP